MADNKPIISFRIRADIKDALQELADADRGRSLSKYIENALEDHILAKRSTAPKRSEGKPARR